MVDPDNDPSLISKGNGNFIYPAKKGHGTFSISLQIQQKLLRLVSLTPWPNSRRLAGNGKRIHNTIAQKSSDSIYYRLHLAEVDKKPAIPLISLRLPLFWKIVWNYPQLPSRLFSPSDILCKKLSHPFLLHFPIGFPMTTTKNIRVSLASRKQGS